MLIYQIKTRAKLVIYSIIYNDLGSFWHPICIFMYHLSIDTPQFSDSFLTDQMCN